MTLAETFCVPCADVERSYDFSQKEIFLGYILAYAAGGQGKTGHMKAMLDIPNKVKGLCSVRSLP